MQVVYADAASADFGDVYGYIASRNPAAALRIAHEIDAACMRLADLPLRGRIGRCRGTRELTTVWPYVIVYRVGAREVTIERIIHGARLR